MRVLSLGMMALFCLSSACGSSDISDDPPVGSADAAAAAIDAAPTIDGAPGAPDATPDTPDAMPDTPDADPNRAQNFCDRYDSLCGYDSGSVNRFDDEAACLTAFGGFDAAQQDCVEGELDAFESDSMQNHCTRATGSGPCS